MGIRNPPLGHEEVTEPASPKAHAPSNLESQSVFWSVLQESAREALRGALGDVILGILAGQKMLEKPEDAARFTERLRTIFGTSGAKTLQFVIAKELYRRLGIPFDPDGLFDYATFLEAARHAFSQSDRLTDLE